MVVNDVILVDEQDNELGQMEKIQAHREGALHRAITVYLFNPSGELLLQQRAQEKYHCGGLWSNTCCGHPQPQENTSDAAHRRLYEEMGLRVNLTPVFQLQYKLSLSNGMTEHEFDHVFFGITREQPVPDPDEAMGWCWQSLEGVEALMTEKPDQFTPWFRLTISHIPDRFATFMRTSFPF